MAAKDYIWDSQAAKQLADAGMTTHYDKNRAHYEKLAKSSWVGLNDVSESKALLKHGDLWDVLLPVISRDAKTLKGLQDKELPIPTAYGGARWAAWFTHYVVEQFLLTTTKESTG
jgi:hypothetical protein